jgi:hypothetical protein
MPMITIQVWDVTGNKRKPVELPDNVPVKRILAVLREQMRLPQRTPDGQTQVYYFHHKRSGKRLLETQCLADVGVQPGDVVRVCPEIVPGGRSGWLGGSRFERRSLDD